MQDILTKIEKFMALEIGDQKNIKFVQREGVLKFVVSTVVDTEQGEPIQ